MSVNNHAPPLKKSHEVEENSKSALQRELNIPEQAPEDVKKCLNQIFRK